MAKGVDIEIARLDEDQVRAKIIASATNYVARRSRKGGVRRAT
ncbi:MAG: hypothetical protein WCF56_10230 [Pseudolabrys sp.]